MLTRSGGELDHDWRNQTVTSNAVPTGLHVHPGETDLLVPLGVVTWTLCRFGLNCRREIPVILVPTPPKYFALPRIVT